MVSTWRFGNPNAWMQDAWANPRHGDKAKGPGGCVHDHFKLLTERHAQMHML